MRVTQSMLSNNMLRNLNTSYSKMSKLQDQLNSGTIINRPSDDPVVAVKGMGYRVDLEKNAQYQRNINEATTWTDATDDALDQTGNILNRLKELIVQAANDTNTNDDRQKIATEVNQLRAQMQDIANTKIGDNYIFSGTYTNRPLFETVTVATTANGTQSTTSSAGSIQIFDVTNTLAEDSSTNTGTQNVETFQTLTRITQDIDGKPGLTNSIEVNVFDGISMQVNTVGVDYFKQVDGFLAQVTDILNDPTIEAGQISQALGGKMANADRTTPIPALESLQSQVLVMRAEVGAKQNRLDLMRNRLELQEINVTKQLSENEDTDYAKTITEMTTAESIHQASLSVGSKIIQQTLVDFLR